VRIMGLDPGTARLGYGILDARASHVQAVGFGVLETPPGALGTRLLSLFTELERLLELHRPDVAVVEQLFFGQNTRSALSVGHARGIILLALERGGVPVLEVTPAQVKQAVAGYGAADKGQVQAMVARLLHLDGPPRPDDAADALAVAWCGLGPARMRERVP
jgi:crossover junction endodeoxyribonuclease RuvC